jgi:hypothetical protein
MAYAISRAKNPQHFAATARRLANFGMAMPSHIVDEGMNWYPAVHEATVKGSRDIGVSTHAGAGIVAAVSPNMDFDSRNINALSDITKLDRSDWGMIERSANQVAPKGTKAKRIGEVSAMLVEKAPSIAAATDQSLLKAGRILSGTNFEEVLNPRTAPKTNRFARNIHDPESYDVTVDGRHHDLIANRRIPWNDSSRGISSADTVSGTRTRYEEMEDVTRMATSRIVANDERFRVATPKDVQAVMWLGGKQVERNWDPTRKMGASRKGQPYMSGMGSPLGL